MTDKEIIIDDVDVSECEKLGETIDGITCGLGKRIRFANEIITKHNLCKNNPNCCYKQLKRKEQECTNLEEELRGCRIGIKNISIENTEICEISEKYKQALDEIEKNIKAMNNECFYDDICECNNCDMKNGCSYYRKFNILNIINKAKEQKC